MTPELYTLYSRDSLIRPISNILYQDSTTTVISSGADLHLVGQLTCPTIWRFPEIQSRPYFLQPDAIYWYSVAETWTTPVPQNRRTRVCIFANNEPSGFYYLGEGWIAGLGFDYKPANTRCLYCRITPKLPRHLWTKFGGYAHWLLTIGDKEFQVAGVEEAMTLIERNWHKSTKELYLTRYERDQLNALVNEKGEAMVRYLQLEPQKELYSGTFDWNSDRTSFVRFSGDEWEVPSSTVVSRALAIDLIKSFLARGRPVGLSPVAG